MGISRCKRVQGLGRNRVKQRIDGISVSSLNSGIGLKAKPGGVLFIDVVIDSNRLHLFMIVARMRNALAIGATVSIIRDCRWASSRIERAPQYREGCSARISVE